MSDIKESMRTAYPNSGLESLAEASRRAESLDTELEGKGRAEDHRDEGEDNNSEPKSPRTANPKGKVRKAYTITKQRERWTEEEHDRFLQALKRYGRAWRKIEEHIGTKTAVQIRSHAQKFFSKLQREQSLNGGRDESSKNDINIPPPRPKRKPMHPYPRNNVDNASEQHEQSRPNRHYQNPSKQKDSDHTTSTQVNNTSNQYSNSSGQQGFLASHHPVFQGHTSPFTGAGSMMSPQPSQVQLPPFPSLDTSGGDSMNKVLKDAAMAAASAWNQVIQGASQKVQHLIQAQSLNQTGMHGPPAGWNQQPQSTESPDGNPFLRQLLCQISSQPSQGPATSRAMYTRQASAATFSQQQETMNQATAAYLQAQRKGSVANPVTKGGRDSEESDKDSACSKEEIRAHSLKQQGAGYWSVKAPYSMSEAKLGRTAWEMMNRVTAQKSLELAKAKTTEPNKPNLMKAPSTASGGSRRIMKPIAHSARISPLQTRDSNLQSTNCSDTSQLAHFYQRAAAEAQRASHSPEAYGKRNAGNFDSRDTGNALQNTRKSDNGSNTATANDEKDQGSNGPEQVASPKSCDLVRANLAKEGDKELFDAIQHRKGAQNGSDKASNNGNGNDSSGDDAALNISDGNGTEEKGSNNGSNSDQASPRESTPVKDGRSTTQIVKEAQKNHTFSHGALPHDAETAWATASLQNQHKELPKQKKPSQAEVVQQILPFTLTKDQQAAISSWAAANAQSQPQQYQIMQTILNGLTTGSSATESNKNAIGSIVLDRQISSLTSLDTGSNTDCNNATVVGRGLGLESYSRSTPGDFGKRVSGFQPYNKRPADSPIAKTAAKRFASGNPFQTDVQDSNLRVMQHPNLVSKREAYVTPFGSDAAQQKLCEWDLAKEPIAKA